MENAEMIMSEVVELMRDMTHARRRDQLDRCKSIATALGLDPKRYDFLALNVARWPDRVARDSNELRYLVDFDHGDTPDARVFLATFDEVCKLLKYTTGSCRVAFNTNAKHQVDRTRRATAYGPCVVTKLDQPVDLSTMPHAHRLTEKSNLRQLNGKGSPTPYARGNKY